MGKQQPRNDMHRKQRAKNVALMLALLGLVAIVYLVTIVRMGGQ